MKRALLLTLILVSPILSFEAQSQTWTFSKQIEVFAEHAPDKVFVRAFKCEVSRNFRHINVQELGSPVIGPMSLDQPPSLKSFELENDEWTTSRTTIPRAKRTSIRSGQAELQVAIEKDGLESKGEERSRVVPTHLLSANDQRRAQVSYWVSLPSGYPAATVFQSHINSVFSISFYQRERREVPRSHMVWKDSRIPGRESYKAAQLIDELCDDKMSLNLKAELTRIEKDVETVIANTAEESSETK